MQLTKIETGLFKLDGGAMFGVVPKQLWKSLNPPDDNNMCTWAMRCLLIETGDRKILVDTGMGDKQDEKFRKHFEPHGSTTLLSSLQQHGLAPEDITDVFLTHLHFDHCGGAVRRTPGGQLVPAFPNATYWTNQRHFDWAMDPNPRERASFLKENFVPLQKAGVLRFIPVTEGPLDWMPGIRIEFKYGHTEAMMILELEVKERKIIYCADLLPSHFHVGLPYVMSYDIRPLVTIAEKAALLERAVKENMFLYFEHDPETVMVTVNKNERGRIVVGEKFPDLVFEDG